MPHPHAVRALISGSKAAAAAGPRAVANGKGAQMQSVQVTVKNLLGARHRKQEIHRKIHTSARKSV